MIEKRLKPSELKIGHEMCYWPTECIGAPNAFRYQRPVQLSGTITGLIVGEDGVMVQLAYKRFVMVHGNTMRLVIFRQEEPMVSGIGKPQTYKGVSIE